MVLFVNWFICHFRFGCSSLLVIFLSLHIEHIISLLFPWKSFLSAFCLTLYRHSHVLYLMVDSLFCLLLWFGVCLSGYCFYLVWVGFFCLCFVGVGFFYELPPFFILSEVNNQMQRAGGTNFSFFSFFFILTLNYSMTKANCYFCFLSLEWVSHSIESFLLLLKILDNRLISLITFITLFILELVWDSSPNHSVS